MPTGTIKVDDRETESLKESYSVVLINPKKQSSYRGTLYDAGDLAVLDQYTVREGNKAATADPKKRGTYKWGKKAIGGALYDVIQTGGVDPAEFYQCQMCRAVLPPEDLTRTVGLGDTVLLAEGVKFVPAPHSTKAIKKDTPRASCPYCDSISVITLTEAWQIEADRHDAWAKEYLQSRANVSSELGKTLEKIQQAIDRQGKDNESTIKAIAEALATGNANANPENPQEKKEGRGGKK